MLFQYFCDQLDERLKLVRAITVNVCRELLQALIPVQSDVLGNLIKLIVFACLQAVLRDFCDRVRAPRNLAFGNALAYGNDGAASTSGQCDSSA